MQLESQSYIDEKLLNQLIDYCKKNNTYAPLIRNLGKFFSSYEYLVKSFQKKRNTRRNIKTKSAVKAQNLRMLDKENIRALDEDEKEKDESGKYKSIIFFGVLTYEYIFSNLLSSPLEFI